MIFLGEMIVLGKSLLQERESRWVSEDGVMQKDNILPI